MKNARFLLFGAALLGLSGCGAPPQVAAVPTAAPTASSVPPAPVASQVVPTVAPTVAPVKVVQSGRSSLPDLPQMMDNSPRPTYVPVPTPKVRPGQTIVISNAPTPAPRENPTLIVSNAPVTREAITPQAAAERNLVWIDTGSLVYHRPGSRFFGTTATGFYLSEAQARRRGYRLSGR